LSFGFVFFFFVSFPVDRFTPSLEQQLSNKLGRKVKIESMSLSPFGNLNIENVTVDVPQAAEPAEEEDEEEGDEQPSGPKDSDTLTAKKKETPKLSYFIEEISVDIGLLSLMMGDLDFDLSMDAFGGEIELEYEGPKPSAGRGSLRPPSARGGRRPTRPPGGNAEGEEAEQSAEPEQEEENDSSSLYLQFSMSEISLKQIHDLRTTLPVPITGELEMSLELESEDGKLSTADGELTMELTDVVMSSKGYKADLGGMQMDVPPLAISSAELIVKFVKGEGEIKSFKVNSKHIDTKLEGIVNLGDRVEMMRFDLYVMFKVLDAYVAQSDALKTILPSLDSFSPKAQRAHRSDGYYGFRFRGPVRSATFQPSQTFSPRKGGASRDRPTRERRSPSRASQRPGMPGGTMGEPDYSGDDRMQPSRPGLIEGAPPPMLSPPSDSGRHEPPPQEMQPPVPPPTMPDVPPPPMEEPPPPPEEPPPQEAQGEEAPPPDPPAEEAPVEHAE
jgi:type II secretion system protein N